MGTEKLLGGYILRVAVRHNRWRISLHDVATHQVKVFGSFKALSEYLEAHCSTPQPSSQLSEDWIVPEPEQ